MNAVPTHGSGGCGGSSCTCAGGAGKKQVAPAAINGISLHDGEEPLEPDQLRERAWGELLRQEAVRQGLLPRVNVLLAPELNARDHAAIQGMLDGAVPLAQPSEDECRRYYEANKSRYVEGRAVHLRHILFAVTDRIDVSKLAVRAEETLLELMRKDVPPTRFGELARELSNCPSGAEGGDLGWVGPDCVAEELANELFHQKNPLHGVGLHPRLVHSRYGLHIVEVLGRRQGKQAGFEQVKARIAVELAQRSRATALHQYIRLLAGQALVEGIDLEGASTPLVQ
jgi:peptidyl-prolyl cis-trans isomerase C